MNNCAGINIYINVSNNSIVAREEAEEVRASVLEILPDPWRPLPGRLDIVSQGARLEAGLDCDEVNRGCVNIKGNMIRISRTLLHALFHLHGHK